MKRSNDIHILLVGDSILDCYESGRAYRLSPESPVPVVLVKNSYSTLGGAANVALNLREIGCKVTFVSAVGNDKEGDRVRNILHDKGIKYSLSELPFTTRKTRVIADEQHVVRFDHEIIQHDEKFHESIATQLNQIEDDVDCIVISDYGKGVISPAVVDAVTTKYDNVRIFVDFKPPTAHLYKNKNIFCMTPNIVEVAGVVNSQEQDHFKLADMFLREMGCHSVLMTMSEKGALFRTASDSLHHPIHECKTRTERHARIDVTGAGDTMISFFSSAVTAGLEYNLALRLSIVAASIVVNKIGTSLCSIDEIREEIEANQHEDFLALSDFARQCYGNL